MYKKTFLIVFSMFIFCICVSANEYRTVCANHILVTSEQDAIKLKSQIETFEDFQFYAQRYSQCPSGRNGGDLGCFSKGQMVKPFEEASFNGNIGEVSDPIKTQFGYHLIWVRTKY